MNRTRILCYIFALCLISFQVISINGESPKVVVVGAGAAGVAVAAKLLEKGIDDVTILEAEDRVGGRIYSKEFDDVVIELGAQWVYGEAGNPVYDLAWPLDLLEHSNSVLETYKFVHSDGTFLDVSKTTDMLNYFNKDVYNNKYQKKDPNEEVKHLGEVVREAMDKYMEGKPELEEHKWEFVNWMKLYVMINEGSDCWREVVGNNEEQWGVEGDTGMTWKPGNHFDKIIDILIKKYPDPSQVLPVMDKMKLKNDVVKIDYSDVDGKVKVETENGDVVEADHVVVTVSLGVLKDRVDSMFVPPLPDWKKEAVEKMGYGNIAKVFLLFDNVWWNAEEEINGFSILWKEKDRERLKDDVDRKWMLNVLGVYKDEHVPNMLGLWIAGEGSRMVEEMPEDKLMEQVKEILEIIKGDKVVEVPKKMIRTDWFKDKHFKGSYSFKSMEAHKVNATMEELGAAIPVDNPKVWFAGEATDVDEYGSVNGAINSGWKVANKLVEMYVKNDA